MLESINCDKFLCYSKLRKVFNKKDKASKNICNGIVFRKKKR